MAAPEEVQAQDSPPDRVEVVLPVEEAKAAAMSIEVRALDGAEYEGAPDGSDAPPSTRNAEEPLRAAEASPTGDALVPPSKRFRKGEWEDEFSGHRVAIELARIESDVRKILDERDPKRKRKFTGTRRWQELEEDIISLKFAGRMDENILRELNKLVMQRHFLFRQLCFIASTRPTWNT